MAGVERLAVERYPSARADPVAPWATGSGARASGRQGHATAGDAAAGRPAEYGAYRADRGCPTRHGPRRRQDTPGGSRPRRPSNITPTGIGGWSAVCSRHAHRVTPDGRAGHLHAVPYYAQMTDDESEPSNALDTVPPGTGSMTCSRGMTPVPWPRQSSKPTNDQALPHAREGCRAAASLRGLVAPRYRDVVAVAGINLHINPRGGRVHRTEWGRQGTTIKMLTGILYPSAARHTCWDLCRGASEKTVAASPPCSTALATVVPPAAGDSLELLAHT